MNPIDTKDQIILQILLQRDNLQSSGVHAELLKIGKNTSLVTTKRSLSRLVNENYLQVLGSGRSTHYTITTMGRIFSAIEANQYCAIEPDKRYGLDTFNPDLLAELSKDIFNRAELAQLDSATKGYKKTITDQSDTIKKKELERLIIELSWKSSKIEGNTYTLLDTERLILKKQEAPGHDKNEAKMILNHKEAFTFIHKDPSHFKTLTRSNLDQVHKLLVKDMGVSFGLRKKPVGIVGSKYQPLDNYHQINDAVEILCKTIARIKTPHAKALVALLGISYIQPFEDGNKRTARLMTNALLLAHKCTPLSYRSVDEKYYRAAMLTFYELNSILPIKGIYIGQYEFAAKHYAVS